MKGRFCSIFLCLFFVSIAASWTEPRCVVSDWYDHATTAIVTVAKKGPGTSCVYLAYAAVAMFDAAAAVDGRFKPFAVAANAPAGASQDAAVVAAAHDGSPGANRSAVDQASPRACRAGARSPGTGATTLTRAPVTGSGWAPAWMASVENPGIRSVMGRSFNERRDHVARGTACRFIGRGQRAQDGGGKLR